MRVETKIEVRDISFGRTCNSGRGFLFMNSVDLIKGIVPHNVTLIFTDLDSLDTLILEAMQLKYSLASHLEAREVPSE